MRIPSVLCAAALAVTAFATPHAVAAPPRPENCVAHVEGAAVAGDPSNLVVTGAVIAVSGQVVCSHDLLGTSIGEMVAGYRGDISIEVLHQNGTVICSKVTRNSSAGPALVMVIEHECVVPATSALRKGPFEVRLHWATMDPYLCCSHKSVWLTPVGVK